MSNEPARPNDQENFLRLFSSHEGNVRAFVTSLLPSWDGVDEVMQEASLVMWRKFDQFDPERPGSKFIDWAFMIARFEVLKYRRMRATDRLVFSEDVFELLATEAEELAAEQSARQRALQGCLPQLEPAQRNLLKAAYADGISIKDAAAKVGRSPTGLYKALARIRQKLHRCIQDTLGVAQRGEEMA
ncbi:MAG: sigma-70 family RNA polymerase sigma factor [Verrucomicrobiota bacterium]